jgi:hypothetical protein
MNLNRAEVKVPPKKLISFQAKILGRITGDCKPCAFEGQNVGGNNLNNIDERHRIKAGFQVVIPITPLFRYVQTKIDLTRKASIAKEKTQG